MEFGGDAGFLDADNFDVIGDIDWDFLFDGADGNGLEPENPAVVVGGGAETGSSSSSSLSPQADPSPEVVVPSIGEIETLLMKDDDNNNTASSEEEELYLANNGYFDQFLADILVDSSSAGSPDSNASADSVGEEKVNSDDADVDPDDPISKKKRRQLRNKDAALRSRERKKMHLRDLEMKSKYLEGECRRLGRLLQCCYAENHVLRVSLQMGNAYRQGSGVLATGQESAVLLLELLLLGSLLWCLDITSVFALPLTLLPLLLINPLYNVELRPRGALESVGLRPRGAASKMLLQSFSKTRRCKASRTKMKHSQFPYFFKSLCENFALPSSSVNNLRLLH